MNYDLLHDVIDLLSSFESNNTDGRFSNDLEGFKAWIAESNDPQSDYSDLWWESKHEGRSAESVISTMLVHLSKYAKTYSKSVIHDSPFSTQDEFIYLINLKAFGALGKMELIKMNIQDKPTGMQIINRLIKHGWVAQTDSGEDKRSKILEITPFGLETLAKHMDKIRKATKIVSGNLSELEKLELISLLGKLTQFHQSIFTKNIEVPDLLNKVLTEYMPSAN